MRPRFRPYVGFGALLKSSRYFVQGDRTLVPRFTARVREYLGMRYVVPVSMARTGYYILFKALGFPTGAEIIFSSLNIGCVIDFTLTAGCTPVFVDTKRGSFEVDEDLLISRISEKTKAIVVTHYFGKPMGISRLLRVCREKGILLIEDRAQAFSTKFEQVGDACIFSMGPYKGLNTIVGGLIATNRPDIHERVTSYVENNCKNPYQFIFRHFLQMVALKLVCTRPLYGIVCMFVDINGMARAEFSWNAGEVDVSEYLSRFSPVQAKIGLENLDRLEARDEERNARARDILESLPASYDLFGRRDEEMMTYLNVPVVVDNPEELIAKFRALGYDTGPSKITDFSDDMHSNTARFVRHHVYVPIHCTWESQTAHDFADAISTCKNSS